MASAGWCGQCFAVVGMPTAGAAGISDAPFVPAGVQPREVLTRTTRWAKTPTTFGPAGRLACTVVLLLVLALLIVGGLVVMFAWGGALIWVGVIMPWALRDIWQAGKVPVGQI